jgi:formiminoglutamase
VNLLSHLDLQHVQELKGREWPVSSIGRQIEPYTMDQMIRQESPMVVLIAYCEPGEEHFINLIRENLYSLFYSGNKFNCADAGKFVGNDEEFQEVISRFRDYGSIPIVLSPDQSLTYQMYISYCNKEQTVNLLSIDDKPDLAENSFIPGNNNWLSFIISHSPNYLFNYSLLGFQTYLSNAEMLKTIQDLHFDMKRLGQIRQNIQATEPLFRNSDFVSFDLSSVRSSDSSSNQNPGPNGLYAEEACQLLRYAGLSNKISSAGIFGWQSYSKENTTSAQLVAQIIWHFADGVLNRIGDGKIGDSAEYTVYKLSSEDISEQLVFYKNTRNGRWWMNVPFNDFSKGKFQKHHIVPCTYEDYLQAMKGEIPETWWQTYQKLS